MGDDLDEPPEVVLQPAGPDYAAVGPHGYADDTQAPAYSPGNAVVAALDGGGSECGQVHVFPGRV